MQITQIDALTYVGPQISVADMQELSLLGVRRIVVARPEGEERGQPAISEICTAAAAFDIRVHQIPVVPGQITDDDVRAFGEIIRGTSDPIFAYCRSGMRATSLWALNAAAQGQAVDRILYDARIAKFDLTGLTARLTENAA